MFYNKNNTCYYNNSYIIKFIITFYCRVFLLFNNNNNACNLNKNKYTHIFIVSFFYKFTIALLMVVILLYVPCFCSNCVLLIDSCDNNSVFSDTKTSMV